MVFEVYLLLGLLTSIGFLIYYCLDIKSVGVLFLGDLFVLLFGGLLTLVFWPVALILGATIAFNNYAYLVIWKFKEKQKQ